MSVAFSHGVTLVGGGQVARADLDAALLRAPSLVAADGGANILMRWGHWPARVIGDLDSLDPGLHAVLADRLDQVAEQDSTDFDKCLGRIAAPFILALGFDGARLDHTLAAMRSLVHHGRARVVLQAAQDICFLAPPVLRLSLPAEARVSLFPMGRVTGRSEGLFWPINGLDFAPDGVIGTSNKAIGGAVRLETDHPRMLVLLDRSHLDQVLDAVQQLCDWR
ncbi:MAG: thiamine diphosphokinase [Roseinatronobacter sp.]